MILVDFLSLFVIMNVLLILVTITLLSQKKTNNGPREIPIIEESIARLLEVNHIQELHDRQWLSKALLALNPHQEDVYDISKLLWRFCVGYVTLNAVTHVAAYPIPCCNLAISVGFGHGKVM